MVVSDTDPVAQMGLPPGFRFFPTDEELLVQYLCRKVAGDHFKLQIIGEIDLYKFDPWILPGKAIFGEKEWYFFTPRDRKYPNGSRPNRVAGAGYWKATGTDKIISTAGRKIGIKKALVFYVGKAPNGIKTNWIMHEYRLLDSSSKIGSSKLDDWVLCRIYEKNFKSSQKQITTATDDKILPMQDHQRLNSPLELAASFNRTQQIDQGLNCSYNNIDISHSIPQLFDSEYTPAKFAGNSEQDEVQGGFRPPRIDNSVVFQPNSLFNNSSNSVDPYGFGYPTRYGEFGFGR